MGEDNKHPDLLTLDPLRAGEAGPEEAAHVATCAECRATLDDLRAIEQEVQEPAIPVPESVDQAIFAEADRALYRAKDSGKDCVKVAGDEEPAKPVRRLPSRRSRQGR